MMNTTLIASNWHRALNQNLSSKAVNLGGARFNKTYLYGNVSESHQLILSICATTFPCCLLRAVGGDFCYPIDIHPYDFATKYKFTRPMIDDFDKYIKTVALERKTK